MRKKINECIALISGGLDSATCAAIAQDEGYEVNAITFDYGQRHGIELKAATRVAEALEVKRHVIAKMDLTGIGGSALTDTALTVPSQRTTQEMSENIPVTYVPCRNILFLSYAGAWAEALGISHIFIGVNAVDYSGYPDCRPEFIHIFEEMLNTGTKAGNEGRPFTLHAPLIHMTKAEIIKRGVSLNVDYGITHSCYNPQGVKPCGICDSCIIRARGFAEAGISDPCMI